jgi:hypothetical protein
VIYSKAQTYAFRIGIPKPQCDSIRLKQCMSVAYV